MFVVCGEALIDVFVENNANSNPYQFPMQACVGGSPFNVAIGLARLEQKSALLTGLSNDMFGERLSSVLTSEGVSQKLIAKQTLPTTVAFIQKDGEGVPTYSFYGDGTADRALLPKDVKLDFDPAVIHLGSYSIVTQPTADSLLALVKEFSGKSIISLDPNIRAIVEPDMKVWQERVEELVHLSDVVKVSDEDLGLMYPESKPEEIIEEWLATGLKLIVLTRGGDGSSLWSNLAKVDIKTPKVKVIDTVGAGDTYQAALLYSVSLLVQSLGADWSNSLSKEKLEEIGSYSASAAAITCSRQGADLPNRDEISDFMS